MSFLKTMNRVVLDIIIKGQDLLRVGTNIGRDGMNMFGGLVISLQRSAVLEDHGKSMSVSLGSGREVDSQVDRLDDGEERLELGNPLEDILGLSLSDLRLELEKDNVSDSHG